MTQTGQTERQTDQSTKTEHRPEHAGEWISVDPQTGEYLPRQSFYCHACEQYLSEADLLDAYARRLDRARQDKEDEEAERQTTEHAHHEDRHQNPQCPLCAEDGRHKEYAVPHWHITESTPGYLPDSEPMICQTEDGARQMVREMTTECTEWRTEGLAPNEYASKWVAADGLAATVTVETYNGPPSRDLGRVIEATACFERCETEDDAPTDLDLPTFNYATA